MRTLSDPNYRGEIEDPNFNPSANYERISSYIPRPARLRDVEAEHAVAKYKNPIDPEKRVGLGLARDMLVTNWRVFSRRINSSKKQYKEKVAT